MGAFEGKLFVQDRPRSTIRINVRALLGWNSPARQAWREENNEAEEIENATCLSSKGLRVEDPAALYAGEGLLLQNVGIFEGPSYEWPGSRQSKTVSGCVLFFFIAHAGTHTHARALKT